MAIKLENKTRVTAPGGDYSYGNIKDTTPTDKGTPLNVETYGDFHQFFAKLADFAGITFNGFPDNDTNTYQYFEALNNAINKTAGLAFVNTILGGSYTANNLIVLYGCTVVANIPGSSTITAGAVFYNGKIYFVPANGSIPSPSNTLVFKIDETVNPNFIYLSNGVSGSGIANYDSASVVYLLGGERINFALGPFTLASASNLSATSGNGVVYKDAGFVYYNIKLRGTTVANSGFGWVINVPTKYIAQQQDAGGIGTNLSFAIRENITDSSTKAFTNGSDDAHNIIINSSGQISVVFGSDLAVGASKSLEIIFQLKARLKT